MPPVEKPTPLGHLKKRVEFLRVRGGRSWRSGSLVLQACKRTEEMNNGCKARFGFTATKKIGGAVLRNRVRRRLKETVRLEARRWARPGYDYVVIARAGALTGSFEDIRKDLRAAFDGVHKEQQPRA